MSARKSLSNEILESLSFPPDPKSDKQKKINFRSFTKPAAPVWRLHLLPTIETDMSVNKRRIKSSSSSTSQTPTELSSETNSTSDDDQIPETMGGKPPILSLPTLYEDEENPDVVKLTCKKCLDMETLLKTFKEMHLEAFETCKGKKDAVWEYMLTWNDKLRQTFNAAKCHLIGELILHIEQAPLTEFKEDHEFRVQCAHYRLLFTHMKSLEQRFNQRLAELNCPIREMYQIDRSDKTLKDLQIKITSSQTVLQQIEQKIQSIAASWDSARVDTNPHGFRLAIFTKEDYIFNRLSNIFICTDFLEKERQLYKEKWEATKPVRKPFLPLLQLKPKREEDLCPKPCNVKRKPQNSVKRKLPSSIAHFYPFTKPQYMDDIHASWYRTFLRSDDIRKEITQQRETNMRVLTDIGQLKKDIHELEVKLKIKEFVESTRKEDDGDDMFPPEKNTTKKASFLDLNSLL